MPLGMISTITICTIIGTIMNAYINASYIVGTIIGILVSGLISFPFKDVIAILDGIVSGAMGGLMGVMVAFMVPNIGLYTVTILLTSLFTLTWVIIRHRIYSQIIKTNAKQVENYIKKQNYFN
jgi:hypothetical protein